MAGKKAVREFIFRSLTNFLASIRWSIQKKNEERSPELSFPQETINPTVR
jgi:hypothetical protein